MSSIKFIFTSVIIVILLLGCKKNNLDIVEGTYTGTFTVKYSSNNKQKGSTTLELKNGEYTCVSGANRIPAGGSGTYSVDNGKITFYDKNIWTADFDWNLILSGQYDYKFNGKRLRISADKNDVGHYKYDLNKN